MFNLDWPNFMFYIETKTRNELRTDLAYFASYKGFSYKASGFMNLRELRSEVKVNGEV